MAYPGERRFEWDPNKDARNLRKHGIGFAEAAELLASDEDYIEVFDEAHSEAEERFIAIGPIERGLVVAVWTEREDDVVRIISARWATRWEAELYRERKRSDHG